MQEKKLVSVVFVWVLGEGGVHVFHYQLKFSGFFI